VPIGRNCPDLALLAGLDRDWKLAATAGKTDDDAAQGKRLLVRPVGSPRDG
jgi:hypothetical protein